MEKINQNNSIEKKDELNPTNDELVDVLNLDLEWVYKQYASKLRSTFNISEGLDTIRKRIIYKKDNWEKREIFLDDISVHVKHTNKDKTWKQSWISRVWGSWITTGAEVSNESSYKSAEFDNWEFTKWLDEVIKNAELCEVKTEPIRTFI